MDLTATMAGKEPLATCSQFHVLTCPLLTLQIQEEKEHMTSHVGLSSRKTLLVANSEHVATAWSTTYI